MCREFRPAGLAAESPSPAQAQDPAPDTMTDTTLVPSLVASDQNLVWIDLEMTGLFPDKDRIIEIAVVVTDPQLAVRVEGPVLAVHQSDQTLDAMDAWNKIGRAHV